MDRKNFYNRQRVEDVDLNSVQTNVENEIEYILQDLNSEGVWSKPSITFGTADNGTVTVGTMVARDNDGKRLNVTSSQDFINMDDLIPGTGGGTEYVVFYIEYNQVESDPRIDGDGVPINYTLTDSFTMNYVNNLNSKPSLISGQVELFTLEIPSTATDITDSSIVTNTDTVIYKDYPKTSKVKEISGTYVIPNDETATHFLVTTSTTTIDITLPAVSDNVGKTYHFIKVDSGSGRIAISGNGSEQINGYPNFYINLQYENVTMFCDGSEWKIFSVDNKQTSYDVDSSTNSYPIGTTDGYDIINVDTGSSSDNTITLPTLSESRGRIITIKKVAGSKRVKIDAGSSNLIDSKRYYYLDEIGQFIKIYCTGTKWNITGKDNIKSTLYLTNITTLDLKTTYMDSGDGEWTYDYIESEQTSNNGTITLPDIATIGNKTINIKLNDNTGTLTISPNGTDTINGFNTDWVITEEYDYITIKSSSDNNWNVIDKGIGTILEYSNASTNVSSSTSDTAVFANDSSANYKLLIPAGTWEIEGSASVGVKANSTYRIGVGVSLMTTSSGPIYTYNTDLGMTKIHTITYDSGDSKVRLMDSVLTVGSIIELDTPTTYYLNIAGFEFGSGGLGGVGEYLVYRRGTGDGTIPYIKARRLA